MSAPQRWMARTVAAAGLLAVLAPTSSAQVVIPPRPGQSGPQTVPGPVRIPNTLPFPANPRKASTYTMPSVNGIPGYPPAYQSPGPWAMPLDYSTPNTPMVSRGTAPASLFNPGLANQPALDRLDPWRARVAVRRPIRNPFVVNQLLLNPLLGERLVLDPFNGPGFVVGGGLILPLTQTRSDSDLAAARRPGSLLDETPDLASAVATGYQPISGIVTLPDGTTYYRGPEGGPATEIGIYPAGGSLDASLMGGSFFSPESGTLGKAASARAFLPYVW